MKITPNAFRALLLLGATAFLWIPTTVSAQAWDMNIPYNVKEGKIDWYSYSGFRRYHSDCHVCHGPNGMGSSYAPGLIDSIKTMSYPEFLAMVVAGRMNVGTADQNVMPSFANNPNVMCYVEHIFSYLKARAAGVLKPGRPRQKQRKPQIAKDSENACMNSDAWKDS